MYYRICNPLLSRSFFLFGARGTGKSCLLEEQLRAQALLWINLLDNKQFVKYSRNPSRLREELDAAYASSHLNKKNFVIIDEVQKIPALLDEVHAILEDRKYHDQIRFALSGSSARKLKRGGANLLAGRALMNELFPLTVAELGEDFSLEEVLSWGTLPAVYTEKEIEVRSEMLESYVALYLKEEIREEQIVRNLDPFNRFLEVAAQSNGKIVNYSSIGRDCQVDDRAVARYFQILEETLLGSFLPSYHRSVRKQQSQSPKFYFFDIGVMRALQGTLHAPVMKQSYGFGDLFEHFIILEFMRMNSYQKQHAKFFYLRTKDNAEIDLIVERKGKATLLIEIKSGTNPSEEDARHLIGFDADFPKSEKWVISQDEHSRLVHGVHYMHWQTALKMAFS